MPCACRHKPVKKLSIRHNSQLIYDTKKLVSPQKSGLRLSREKKSLTFQPAPRQATEPASVISLPVVKHFHSVMCAGTSCSQQFYTKKKGAWERRGPQRSRIEIIKCSCDCKVSISANTGPKNKTKSPYLMQTCIHKKGGKPIPLFL